MILQSLYNFYHVLLDDPDCEIAPPGYSAAKVSFSLILSHEGELLDVRDLRISNGKKALPRTLIVPEQPKRTSGTLPFFLCDNAGYVLGLDEKRGKVKYDAFCDFQKQILASCPSIEAHAVIKFLDTWDVEKASVHSIIKDLYKDIKNANLVFQLDGSYSYVHDVPEIKAVWERYLLGKTAEYEAICLVTGKKAKIANIHPSIKGVFGAQSSGAALVSFNIPSFKSFGKDQSYNAPVSEEAAFGYTTALNYLLADPKHRLSIIDTTTVFWAEKPGSLEEEIFSYLLNPPIFEEEEKDKNAMVRDQKTRQLLEDTLKRVSMGLPIKNWIANIDGDMHFYILGLSPNNARLAVRFWHMDTLNGFAEKIGQHYADLKIEGLKHDAIPVWMILKETAVRRELKNVSPILEGGIMRAILTGDLYPQTLYTSIINRIRSDHEINSIRAAIIKACLLRKAKKYRKVETISEEVLPMSLNARNGETARNLGALFAILEKIQQNANPGINATIKERYFNSASATPSTVFPQLMRLSNHHLAKLETGSRIYWENKVMENISQIENFPARLTLEEQGLFMLGYYHQRENFFNRKNEEKREDD